VTDKHDPHWQEALRRRQVLEPLASLSAVPAPRLADAAERLGLSPRQVRNLLACFRADPRTSSLRRGSGGRPAGLHRLNAVQEALIAAIIDTYHATRQKPRKTDSYRELCHRCHQQGVRPPHYETFIARLRTYDPRYLLKAREGAQRAHEQLGPVRAHFEAHRPLELVQIDHTRVDLLIVDRLRREPLDRPWLTLAVDVYSRVVLGIHVAFEAPSATAVALCLAQACLDKKTWLAERSLDLVWPGAGLPEAIHLDNAREFHSQALIHGCEQHGIIINYRPVATPHYGGHIERLIGTLMGKVHLLPGTTFSNVNTKGDYDPAAHATMTLPEFERWLALEIAHYHDTCHRTLETTPRGAWQAGLESQGAPRAVADPPRFLLDFLPVAYRQLRRDGVHLHGLRYWSDTFGLWLGRLTEKCPVRFDPRDLSVVWVRLPDGDDIAAAYADLRWPRITLWELRSAQRALRAQGLAAADPDAAFRVIEAQRELVAAAGAATDKARRVAAKQEEARRAAAADRAGRHAAAGKGAPVESDGVDYSRPPRPFDVEIW
jgi:putative transposase